MGTLPAGSFLRVNLRVNLPEGKPDCVACCDHSLTVCLPGVIGATLLAEPPAEPRARQGAEAHYGLN